MLEVCYDVIKNMRTAKQLALIGWTDQILADIRRRELTFYEEYERITNGSVSALQEQELAPCQTDLWTEDPERAPWVTLTGCVED